MGSSPSTAGRTGPPSSRAVRTAISQEIPSTCPPRHPTCRAFKDMATKFTRKHTRTGSHAHTRTHARTHAHTRTHAQVHTHARTHTHAYTPPLIVSLFLFQVHSLVHRRDRKQKRRSQVRKSITDNKGARAPFPLHHASTPGFLRAHKHRHRHRHRHRHTHTQTQTQTQTHRHTQTCTAAATYHRCRCWVFVQQPAIQLHQKSGT